MRGRDYGYSILVHLSTFQPDLTDLALDKVLYYMLLVNTCKGVNPRIQVDG